MENKCDCDFYKKYIDLVDKFNGLSIVNHRLNIDFDLVSKSKNDQNKLLNSILNNFTKEKKEYEEKLEYFDEEIEKLKKYLDRISNLEKHKNYQIDENRKISNEVYLNNASLTKKIELQEHLLESFQSIVNSLSNQVVKLEKRIEVLEEENKKTSEDIKLMRTKFLCEDYLVKSLNNPKKPQKCPVCDDKVLSEIKIKKTESGNDKLVIECHACEGKGIVWG